MTALWLLAVQLGLAANCERNLRQQAYFSPTVIARAIGRFDSGLERRVFSVIVRSFSYTAIEKHFGLTAQQVADISRRGGSYLVEEKNLEDERKKSDN